MSLHVDIKKSFGDFNLDISFESSAKRIGILGASGSGKSMTLKSIAGIETPDRGIIALGDRALFDSEKRIDLKPQTRKAGYMFQNYALFPSMTVLQNVMAGIQGTKEEKVIKAREIMRRFGIEDLAGRLPRQISGGQQQRTALARIMASQPEIILLDEPFSALDLYLKDKMQVEMMQMLEEYEGQIVMVSHSRDEIYRFSDELFVIRNGKVISGGDTKSVFMNPGKIETAKMTGCKNFSDVKKIDDHTLYASEWGITVKLSRRCPDNVKHIGYRAHRFVPVWGNREENCIKFNLLRIDYLPFEQNYYLMPEDGRKESGNLICWFVQSEMQKLIKEKGMPDYLKITEEDLLLLE